ncbi:hypothetical protein BB934_26375 [Microvirga ossetica]|uniref:WYL domain-containing protein n=1 Tax=Microvirga ossetica TaxID=1882682 RepID=A0A1B2EMY4_9HYPH|nr:WYL domain-containing protein [Microvirga ossetica]ANY81311.1 hypothetical protein BB934_26375 [Microvirga ossetica]
MKRGGEAILRRLRWIEDTIHWTGQLRRRDLCAHFNISPQQASSDIGEYLNLVPGNIRLSSEDKVYRQDEGYRPIFEKDAARWVQESSTSLDPPTIPIERISTPWQRADDGIIAAIIQSYSQKTPLSVLYQSLTSRDARRRTICPHRLVEDGNRLHARTWDYERNAFIDLVLTRMSDPEPDQTLPWIDGAADRDWNERIDIDLEPNPSLSPGQADVVMREIGLPPKGGRISVRRAEALYLLEHLGIRSAVQDGAENPAARIVCTNQVEVRETLRSR